ncbi:uncharacterized mitochondrial protein-like protein [Tanacetum coccineum]
MMSQRLGKHSSKSSTNESGLVSVNTARQVNAAHTKTTVNAARPMSYLSKIAPSTVKRPIHKNIAFNVNIVRLKAVVNAAKPKAVVNAARPKAVVNDVKGNNVNAIKASACWADPNLQDQGVIDSGCSRHMTGNISYLTDYEEIDGGYVAFGGNPKGGKITGKDDYSRFSWVFFLATKDETSRILKSFIIGVENLIDQRVKVIRCDNGTEFKNKEMNQFCKRKGKAGMETIPGKDYILLPLWTANPPFSQSSKSSPDARFKPLGDDEKKVTKEPGKEVGDLSKEDERDDQEKDVNVNNTSIVNAASTNEVNVVGAKTSIELPDDLNMPELEDIVYSGNDEDVGAEPNMNNWDAFMPARPILTTRVHKDHPVEQIIGDLNSAPQTRRKTKNLGEHGRTQNGNSCFEGSKLDRGYVGRSSTIQIKEEVYVCQPLGFKDPDFPDRVYKVEKALYRLHQASRACTPMKTQKLLLKDEEGEEVDVHVYRSMIGSLMYPTSSRLDIMFAVCQPKLGLWYPKDSPFDLVAYTDSDYAEASLDRKSTIRVNTARHNLLLLLKVNAARHNLLLLLKVSAARHKLTTAIES